jgi:hypothetical protein
MVWEVSVPDPYSEAEQHGSRSMWETKVAHLTVARKLREQEEKQNVLFNVTSPETFLPGGHMSK